MVKTFFESKTIKIPENSQVNVEGRIVSVKGPLGELRRDFSHAPVSIKVENGEVVVEAPWPDKKQVALIGTIGSHVKNMITGVTKGFTYKLKIVFAHFPVSVKVKDGKIFIENFGGERKPRIAKIVGDVKVSVKGDDIIIQGISLQDVSQTAANIEQATRVKKKDARVFLDGIYVYEKTEGMTGV